MIEGWRTFPLAQLAQRHVTASEFRNTILESRYVPQPQLTAVKTPINFGGSANVRYRKVALPEEKECREFVQSFCSCTHFRWPAEQLVFLNRPCYLVIETGVVLLEDRSIVAETVFPSIGENTIERQVGGGLNANNIAETLRNAPAVDGGTWAPLLSRWSAVYFHALTESLVQDTVFAYAGLAPLISHAVPASPPQKGHLIVTAHTSSHMERFTSPVIKIPRVVFSTAFYKHSALGVSFRQFVERAKAQAFEGDCETEYRKPQKIYIGRLGASARRMTNEAELIAQLERIGFHAFVGGRQPLQEQVRTFRDASLIVGPHGSGLTNVAFAGPDATLCELRPLNTRGSAPMGSDEYLRLCAVMGFRYCAHVSSNNHDEEEWEANLPEIIKVVEAIS
jgi:hypothetical protein